MFEGWKNIKAYLTGEREPIAGIINPEFWYCDGVLEMPDTLEIINLENPNAPECHAIPRECVIRCIITDRSE